MYPTRVRYQVLGFACSLSLLTYLDRICISRVQGEIMRDLGVGDRGMGLVFSAFSLGYCLFEVPGGWMGDAWGSRRVITRIVVWWSLFTALTGCIWPFSLDSGYAISLGTVVVPLVFDGLLALLIVRFLFGCGEAGAYPNLSRVAGAWFPFRERARAQGAIWMSARIGGAIAAVVIGRLTIWLGWRQAFWLLGGVGIVWAAVFYRWFRDRPEDKPTCNAAERELIRADPHSWKGHQAGAGPARPPWRRLLRSANVWFLCLASFSVTFGWFFYPTWQPRYLKDVHAIDYADSELLTGLPFLCGALGCLLGGGLSDQLIRATGSRRWGRSLVGVAGFTGPALCVLGAAFASSAWQAVLLLSVASFINDFAIPTLWAASTDIGGRFAGTVSGIMNTASALAAVIMPPLIPELLNAFPADYGPGERWNSVLGILGCCWFVGALAWLGIDASKPIASDPAIP